MTASPRWKPDDAELDAVARSIDAAEPSRERAEQTRTALLAGAATRTQRSRFSPAPWIAGGVALAAAAAAAIWIGTRPAPETSQIASAMPTQIIAPIGVARFDRMTDWPDFVVRLSDGKLGVYVAELERGERFRVTTADAEVESRGARFEVAADAGTLASVAVRQGRVEIRRPDQQVVILSAGESWAPAQTATREDIVAPADSSAPTRVVPAAPPPTAPPRKIERAPIVGTTRIPAKTQLVAPMPEPAAPAPPQAPLAPKPGEAEFRAGMAALRASDPTGAARSFTAACRIAQRDALGEDACFWAGGAAKRAGDVASARAALASFLQTFPGSARAPEAAALLGWLLYDAGDLDGAEALFHRADHDRVPQVRDSAQRGLTAIDRRRHAP